MCYKTKVLKKKTNQGVEKHSFRSLKILKVLITRPRALSQNLNIIASNSNAKCVSFKSKISGFFSDQLHQNLEG